MSHSDRLLKLLQELITSHQGGCVFNHQLKGRRAKFWSQLKLPWEPKSQPLHHFPFRSCSKLLEAMTTMRKVGKWPLIRAFKCYKNILKSKNCHIIKYFVSWLEKSNRIFCTSDFIKNKAQTRH